MRTLHACVSRVLEAMNPGKPKRGTPMRSRRRFRRASLGLTVGLVLAVLAQLHAVWPPPACADDACRVQMANDEAAGRLTVSVDGREAFVYRYGPKVDLVHYYPLRSPSGKNMLVQITDPYPHHRAFWFADRVRAGDGPAVATYSAVYSGKEVSRKVDPDERLAAGAPYATGIRHAKLDDWQCENDEAVMRKSMVWYYDNDKPLADEQRTVRVVALGDGEYLLDITFKLTAAHGALTFTSDSVHYAWPYLRINDKFNGDHGGTITNDRGAQGQKETNMKPAKWVDYSNTVDGETEGLAVFQWPDGEEHRWLTREYGTFGPRRPDARSGKHFTVPAGESITQRVGVLVHQGDVKSGRVAERYAKYVEGEL